MIANKLIRLAGVVTAFVGCTTAVANESVRGDAFDAKTGTLLYREIHFVDDDASRLRRLVLYECPDGRPFARKAIRRSGDPQAPDFEMVDARWNYREGVRTRDGVREAFVQRSEALPENTQTLEMPSDAVIDAGFDEFVRKHWDDLAAGRTLDFPFLVPSRRRFFDFKVAALSSEPTLLRIRLSLGAWYSFLLPHIDVAYERRTRRLIEYDGMSNIRDGALKNYNVHTRFSYALTEKTLAAALDAPLSPDCATVRADTATSVSGH